MRPPSPFFNCLTYLACFGLALVVGAAVGQNTAPPDPARPALPDTLQPAPPLPDSTASQEAEAEGARVAPPSPFRFRLTADGSFTSGNVNRSLLQLVGSFDLAVSKVAKLSTAPSFVYGRQNGVLNEREYFADARLTLLPENRLYYLAFGSLEKSNLRQIFARYTAAAGLGYKLVTVKQIYISITNVLLRENTDFATLNDMSIFRNSTRLFGEYTFSGGRWVVSHTVFYQPALHRKEGQATNVRWNGVLSVQHKFSTYLSFRTTLANSYESIVVPGRVNNDLRLTLGLTYERN